MSKSNIKPTVTTFSSSVRFDEKLDNNNWIRFIIQLRKVSVERFGLASKAIITMKKDVIRVRNPTRKDNSRESITQHEIFRDQLRQAQRLTDDYNISCQQACQILMNDEFMSDSIQGDIMRHELFYLILSNQEPTPEQCQEHMITPTEIFYDDIKPRSSKIFMGKKSKRSQERRTSENNLESNILSTPDPVSIDTIPTPIRPTTSSNLSRKSIPKEITNVKSKLQDLAEDDDDNDDLLNDDHTNIQQINEDISSDDEYTVVYPTRTPYNLILLLKIARNIVLNINKDTYKSQELAFNRMSQTGELSDFGTFVKHYQERLAILDSLGIKYSDTELSSHFLRRVNEQKHLIPVNLIYTRKTLPTYKEVIQIIESDIQRRKNNEFELSGYGIHTLDTSTINSSIFNLQSKPVGNSKSSTQPKKLSRPCRHCGKWHLDRTCPTLKKSNDTKSQCLLCNLPHHISSCPSLPTARSKLTPPTVQSPPIHTPQQDRTIHYSTYMAMKKPTYNLPDIYLDSGAMEHIFSDSSLLNNISTCNQPISIHGITDATELSSKDCGYFGNILVYHIPGATANLLSYSRLIDDGYQIYTKHKGKQLLVKDHNETFMIANSIDGIMKITYINPKFFHHGIPTSNVLLTKRQLRQKETKFLYDSLGKPTIDQFISMLSNGNILGTNVTPQDVRLIEIELDIEGARTLATAHNSTRKHSATPTVNNIGELLHADIIYDDLNNLYLFTSDRLTHFRTITPIQNKRSDTLCKAFRNVITIYHSYHHGIKQIVTDNDASFRGCKSYLSDLNILLTFIPSGIHNQISERSFRTLKEKVNILKASLSYRLPSHLEPRAYEYATYLLNRHPNVETSPFTPWELFSNTKLDLRSNPLAPFGQVAIFFQPTTLRTPAHPDRAEYGIIVGKLPDTPSGFLVYIPSRNDYVIRSNNYTPYTNPPSEWNLPPNPYRTSIMPTSDHSNISPTNTLPQPTNSSLSHDINIHPNVDITRANDPFQPPNRQERTPYNLRPNPTPLNKLYLTTTKQETITTPILKTYIKNVLSDDNPKNHQARDAIKKELLQMKHLHVFETIKFEDIPIDQRQNIISSIMFLKDKYKADGTYDKTKARLAARGDLQSIQTLFNQDTSSPTVNLITFMTCLSISVKHKCYITTMDIPGAYLHASLPENVNIYMSLPRGTESIWTSINDIKLSDYNNNNNNKIYVKLNKALYGLKQSSNLWYTSLTSYLLSIQFKCSTSDPCLFYKYEQHNFIIIIIYVDDLLILSTTKSSISDLQDLFIKKYGSISIQNPPTISFLSLNLCQNSTRDIINIDQNSYIKTIIELVESKYEVKQQKYPSNDKLFQDSNEFNTKLSNQKDYIKYLMMLMYAANRTRPDILKEVVFLATKSNNATETDMKKLLRIIGYLKLYPTFQLLFQHSTDLSLQIYADASYRVHHDTAGHTGFIIRLYNNNIFYRSIKQKIIVKSSSEAELISLDDSLTYGVWILELLNELNMGINLPIIIYQDNMSTIYLASNGKGNFKRSKHISNRYFWIKQFIDQNIVTIKYIPSASMIADLLTKSIIGQKFIDSINSFLPPPKGYG